MANDKDRKSRILLFGYDRGLLTTRQLLLQRDGYDVHLVTTMQDFLACLLSEAFELILLCQSLSGDECELAAHLTQKHAPSTRLLLMFTRVGKCIPERADVLLDSLAGPRAFIETTRRMLGNNTSYAA